MTTRVVDDYMTPLVYVLAPEDTLAEAQDLMSQSGVRHLPVVEGEAVLGIVTLSDLFVHGHLLGTGDAVPVKDLMSRDLFSVDGSAALGEVARTMAARRVGSAVVLHQGKPAGVFTTTDALRALADALGAP